MCASVKIHLFFYTLSAGLVLQSFAEKNNNLKKLVIFLTAKLLRGNCIGNIHEARAKVIVKENDVLDVSSKTEEIFNICTTALRAAIACEHIINPSNKIAIFHTSAHILRVSCRPDDNFEILRTKL
jgi:hypothetical protein